VRGIVAEGADKAREVARQTLDEVRRTMHLRRTEGIRRRNTHEAQT